MSDKLALSDKAFIHNQVRQERGDIRQEARNLVPGVRGGTQDYQILKKANNFISKYYKEPNKEV